MSCVVFKLGGSLLDLPDLPSLCSRLLALRPESAAVFVVGGGTTADQVRTWDRVYNLGSERAHSLALAAMRFNAEFLLRIIPGAAWVRCRDDLKLLTAGSSGVADADALLETRAAGGRLPRLPYDWSVTSDSIAAWIAAALRAEELVLLKSVDLEVVTTPRAAAEAGLVDPHFEQVVAHVPCVGWINARRSPLTILPWLQQGLPVSR